MTHNTKPCSPLRFCHNHASISGQSRTEPELAQGANAVLGNGSAPGLLGCITDPEWQEAVPQTGVPKAQSVAPYYSSMACIAYSTCLLTAAE
jgi:hypothetical protein